MQKHLQEVLPGELALIEGAGNGLDCRWRKNCIDAEGNTAANEVTSDGQGAGDECAAEAKQGGHCVRLEKEVGE